MKKILLSIAVFIFCYNLNYGTIYTPKFDFVNDSSNVLIKQEAKTSKNQISLLLKSNYLPKPDKVIIYLPANYSKDKKYGVVYMLHGWSGDETQWGTTADLRYYSDNFNFIIVCPDGFYDSWYVNSPKNKSMQFENYFFKELIDTINNRFSVDKNNIFITGLSMGGFGAMSFFIKHNEIFKAAGSTSGILDIEQFKGKWGMDKSFDDKSYHTFAPINNLELLKNNKPFIVDCGTEDFSYKVNYAFYQKCIQLKLPVTFYSGPGSHNHSYWNKSIARHFAFFYDLMNLGRNSK